MIIINNDENNNYNNDNVHVHDDETVKVHVWSGHVGTELREDLNKWKHIS